MKQTIRIIATILVATSAIASTPYRPAGAAPEPSPDTQTSIVTFQDAKAKEEFSRANDDAQTTPAPVKGQAAVVADQKPDDLRPVDGANIYPNKKYRALLLPNDPNLSSQTYLNRISAPAGWGISTGANSQTIAIIDTGFDLEHEDLKNKWATNSAEMGSTTVGTPTNCDKVTPPLASPLDKRCNGVDDDNNGFADDWRGWNFDAGNNYPEAGITSSTGGAVDHGTIVAGLTGAQTNNALGGAGVSWGAKLLPVQVLDDNGDGYTSSVAAGIDYAVARGAKVINLSLGLPGTDDFLQQHIDAAITAGVTVVAAAGNCGGTDYAAQGCNTRGQVIFPANYDPVIAVGSVDATDTVSSFSSYGSGIDVVAPGEGPTYSPDWDSGGSHAKYVTSYVAGTSFAAPIVSGVVSLVQQVTPGLSPADIQSRIRSNADKVAGMNAQLRTDRYGYGRIDVASALANDRPSLNVPLYRLYNPRSGDHLFTVSGAERLSVLFAGWQDEGTAAHVSAQPQTGLSPVYRLYNPYNGEHFYTSSPSERDAVANTYMHIEGIAYYASNPAAGGLTANYRLYNPYTGKHFYTISPIEKDIISHQAWRYEGIANYISP